MPICACVATFRVASNKAEFNLSLCQGLRAGFELESLFTYIRAGVSGGMKRYVLNVYSYFCSLCVLCKHHVAMGVYLALDPHTSVCSTQGFMSTTYGTFFLKVFESCLLKGELFYYIIGYQISFETRLLSTIHVLRNVHPVL